MKRTLCRLLVALATFLIGATSHRVFDRHEEASSVRVTSQDPDEFPLRPQFAEPDVVFDYDPTEFNPRGDYFILGPKPKEFSEFDCLEIAVDEDKISGQVSISTKVESEYDVNYEITGLVTRQRIYIVAKPWSEENVGYHFEGEFLRQGEVWRAGKSEAVLKGRLSKTKDGQTIAEAEVEFRIEYLGC